MLDLQAFKKRLGAITQQNWSWSGGKKSENGNYTYVPQESYLGDTLIMMGDTYEGHAEDADFIANAPNDIVVLIEEVERLRGAIDDICVYVPASHSDEVATIRQALEGVSVDETD